jgi:hypothetical protein
MVPENFPDMYENFTVLSRNLTKCHLIFLHVTEKPPRIVPKHNPLNADFISGTTRKSIGSVIIKNADRIETLYRTLLIFFRNSSTIIQEYFTNSDGIIQN